MRDAAYLVPLILVFALLIALAGGLIATANAAQARVDSFKAHCTEQGGHVYGTGLYLCLNGDGRVVEVYP